MKTTDLFNHVTLRVCCLTSLLFASLILGCSDEFMSEDFMSVDKTGRPQVSGTFQQNHPLSDQFFNDKTALSKSAVQSFLERSPYGRSWLADYTISGQKASDMIYQVAQSKELNPILLLSRLQVEASLISSTTRPAQHLIDRAMGCGCHDGQACQANYLGLENQITALHRSFAACITNLSMAQVGGERDWVSPHSTRFGLSLRAMRAPRSMPTRLGYSKAADVARWKTAKLFDEHVRTEA